MGIGTASPATDLDVAGNILTSDALYLNSLNVGSMAYFSYGGGNSKLWNTVNGALLFGTNNSEAMRIDSSGRLLVGKTSTGGGTTEGTEIHSDGYTQIVRDSFSNNPVVYLGKLTNDGEIVRLTKDGTTVGSIGTDEGTLYIGRDDTGVIFEGFAADSLVPYNPSTNTIRDNTINLGYASSRFKDLYLSGGVYLGGTGSANLLDDYEEGTFSTTVTVGGGSVTTSTAGGIYTKIGDVVHLQGELEFSSVSTPTGFINLTLPFTPNATYASVGTVLFENSVSKNVQDFVIYIRNDLGSARIYIADVNVTSSVGANAQEIDTSTSIRFTLTYKL